QPGDTCYEWQANGMLAGVRTPDGRTITFGYDALGRRVSKRTGDTVHRFGWDGNVVLHEWDTDEARRPRLVTDETGREEYDGTEKPEGLVTWVYDGTSFTPVAKVTDGERYTIVHDYLGTPTQAYNSKGELVWEMLLDVYGEVMECRGDRTLVPFRYQGQYEDEETGLYYNRSRYYSPDMGMYISSDPIGLAGNNPTLYAYVSDTNSEVDVFGLFFGKIIGLAQSTGTFGHAFVSKMYALIYSLNPNVKRVTMDLGYKRLLGGGNFKYGPRPDVGILYKNGTVKIIEVASKTDIVNNLKLRNNRFMQRNGIIGEVKVSGLAQMMNSLKDKLKNIAEKFKPCR
ncbi:MULTISPECIES: RHS repeat domain-containing protein, partial [Bacteroidales]